MLRSIGKGSYGKVYLAKHLRESGTQYVIKVVKLKGIPPKERCVSYGVRTRLLAAA